MVLFKVFNDFYALQLFAEMLKGYRCTFCTEGYRRYTLKLFQASREGQASSLSFNFAPRKKPSGLKSSGLNKGCEEAKILHRKVVSFILFISLIQSFLNSDAMIRKTVE